MFFLFAIIAAICFFICLKALEEAIFAVNRGDLIDIVMSIIVVIVAGMISLFCAYSAYVSLIELVNY